MRLQFPRLGKDKLAVSLQQQEVSVSTSIVGRILTRLKHHGQLREAPRSGIAARPAASPMPRAKRSSTRCLSPEIWSRSIPSTCALCQAWPSGCVNDRRVDDGPRRDPHSLALQVQVYRIQHLPA